MNRYQITLQHDGGRITVQTAASSQGQAIRQVLAFEGAPESAIQLVTDLGPVIREN
jgi:hypothetical protein